MGKFLSLISIVSILLLTACQTTGFGSSWAGGREPANIQEFEGSTDPTTLADMRAVKAAFASGERALYNSVQANAQRRMNQILKRSAAAAALMNKFDKELDSYFDANGKVIKPFDLQASNTYTKLQNTRDLVETVEGRLVTIYAYVWKLYLYPESEEIPAHRVARVKENAEKFLKFVHAEVGSYTNDVRIIGLHRIKNHLVEVAEHLSADARNTGGRSGLFGELMSIIDRLNSNERQAQNISYDEFISLAGKIVDREYETEMKNREPNSNIVVEGFKNTTGSEFGANKWVLTFDDGPHKDNTLKIAEILKDNKAKGDFFWLSKLVKTQPGIAKSIYDDGFGIASHSVDHSNLPKLSESKIKDQVSGSRDVIEKALHDKGATNYKMKDFRCPYGACWAPKSKAVQQAIKDAGLRHVYWTVDTLDWQDKNTQSVLARILKQMKASGRGIILFHDIHPVAGNVLPLLFKEKYIVDNKVEFLSL